jgi:hypothetical protein
MQLHTPSVLKYKAFNGSKFVPKYKTTHTGACKIPPSAPAGGFPRFQACSDIPAGALQNGVPSVFLWIQRSRGAPPSATWSGAHATAVRLRQDEEREERPRQGRRSRSSTAGPHEPEVSRRRRHLTTPSSPHEQGRRSRSAALEEDHHGGSSRRSSGPPSRPPAAPRRLQLEEEL